MGYIAVGWEQPPDKKSLACIPGSLVFYRKRRGWTQKELAQAAGYTPRLVGKAESGKPISVQTIEDLADALSDQDYPVHPEDLVTNRVELAKLFVYGSYEYGKETFSRIQRFLSPKIEWIFDGSPSEVPFAGRHVGLEAVEKALELFFELLEAPADCDYRDTHAFLINESDPNELIVWGKSFFYVKGQPIRDLMSIQVRMLFYRGRLIHVDDRYDTQYARRQFENYRDPDDTAQSDDSMPDEDPDDPQDTDESS